MWKLRPDEDGYYWYRRGENEIYDDLEGGIELSSDYADRQIVGVQGNSVYLVGSEITLDMFLLTGQYKKVEL
jgi:hypothetical protein